MGILFLHDARIYTACTTLENDMNDLPLAIAQYIEASNAQDPKRVAASFCEDAEVRDEGHVRRGRDNIEAWARESAARYQCTIEPDRLEETDGRHRLRATVSGTFPGSPIALNFDFQLRAGGIDSLEITP